MRLHLYSHYLTRDIIEPKKDSVDAMPEGQALPEPNREVNRGGRRGTRRIKTRRSGNSRVDSVMIQKIKLQRAQRITESCYFHLSPTLRHPVSSVVFRDLISNISKSLPGFGHRNARCQRPYFLDRKHRIGYRS